MRSEDELTANLVAMRKRLTELKNSNEMEMANAIREKNKLLSERNNAERSLEVLKNAAVDRNADYDREILRLSDRVNELEREKAMNLERLEVLIEQGEREDIGDNVRSDIERESVEIEERNSEIDEELEGYQRLKSLRDRIKEIFTKYGFTITAVVTAVGVVIGAILSKLSAGLSKMATGVGNGLKDIGKKLAQILPGIVGAIASFIFRTAGEVIGFLAKNAWLLIVAVVVYFVESLKNKKK